MLLSSGVLLKFFKCISTSSIHFPTADMPIMSYFLQRVCSTRATKWKRWHQLQKLVWVKQLWRFLFSFCVFGMYLVKRYMYYSVNRSLHWWCSYLDSDTPESRRRVVSESDSDASDVPPELPPRTPNRCVSSVAGGSTTVTTTAVNGEHRPLRAVSIDNSTLSASFGTDHWASGELTAVLLCLYS